MEVVFYLRELRESELILSYSVLLAEHGYLQSQRKEKQARFLWVAKHYTNCFLLS